MCGTLDESGTGSPPSQEQQRKKGASLTASPTAGLRLEMQVSKRSLHMYTCRLYIYIYIYIGGNIGFIYRRKYRIYIGGNIGYIYRRKHRF